MMKHRVMMRSILEQWQRDDAFFSKCNHRRSQQIHADLRGGEFALTAHGVLMESQRPCDVPAAQGR